jgi:hypothetical protein
MLSFAAVAEVVLNNGQQLPPKCVVVRTFVPSRVVL